MNSPSAASTAVPAREKAHAATAATTASTGPRVQRASAAASTAAAPAIAVAYAQGGAQASGQARVSSPREISMIAKTLAPENGVKPFVIMARARTRRAAGAGVAAEAGVAAVSPRGGARRAAAG